MNTTTLAISNREKTSRTPIVQKIERKGLKSPLKFKEITISDMGEIYPYLEMESGRTCDFSYGGVLMWVSYYSYEYCIYKDTLFIRGKVEGDRLLPAFSIPIGSLPLDESVMLLKDYCQEREERLIFSAVPEYALDEFKALNPLKIRMLADMGDYIYSAESLSTLRGKKMSKKRNHVNKFESLYPSAEYRELKKGDVDSVLTFMDNIDKESDKSDDASAERQMTRDLLVSWKESAEESPLEGGILKVDGKIVAFTVGDKKKDTLYVHIEKGLREVEGSFEAINKYFASSMKEKYPEIEYVNREDDAGDIGLRMAKESYRPLEILQKYNILF